MEFFETHCHLNHPRFDDDREAVVERARTAGVREFLIIGYNRVSSRRAVALANPGCGGYAAAGIHPHDALEWDAAAERELRVLLTQPGVVALGEIGLDFYRDLSPRDAQYAAFQAQLELALELSLPIVVHTRESVTPSLDVLEPFASRGGRGIMHCWSGSVEEARRALSLGFLLGVGGVITYPKAGELPDVVRESPLDRLVLETDCPYLTPLPHLRRERNEPAWLVPVAEKVAELRGIPVADVVESTTGNARRLLQPARV